jgi:putative ABC transport system ATP-binding protein
MADDQDEIVIRGEGLSKSYGSGETKIEALKNASIQIRKGQLTLLVGPSGSGKTTLISIIATILTPDVGGLSILNQPVLNMSEIEKSSFRGKSIGIVFQSLFLIPTLTVAENVALPLIIGGMHEKQALKQAREQLEPFRLAHRSEVAPTSLSKGQQQRVAIARAMINNAPIIICDEPTSSLDHVSGFEIMNFLQTMAKNSSKAVLVVTHDPRIFSYADRIISMSDGEITPEE